MSMMQEWYEARLKDTFDLIEQWKIVAKQLKAENDQLLADKERLDAAEKMRLCLVSEPNGQWTYQNPSDNTYPSIRAAIDAAKNG